MYGERPVLGARRSSERNVICSSNRRLQLVLFSLKRSPWWVRHGCRCVVKGSHRNKSLRNDNKAAFLGARYALNIGKRGGNTIYDSDS